VFLVISTAMQIVAGILQAIFDNLVFTD
jgi:hypothetical protein